LALTGAGPVAVVNTKLYLVGSQFYIVDVTNPAVPVLLSASNSYAAQRVAAIGSLAFLVTPAVDHTDPTGGLYVLDVSNALQPQLLKKIVVPGTSRTVIATTTMVYTGDSAATLDVVDP
jgi:hypothetical protein